MKPLRFGVMGLGRISEKFVKTVRDYDTGAAVAAVASRSGEHAKAYAEKYGIPAHCGSYAEMLQSAEIDAVYVSTTNEKHYGCCVLAIEAGKHVLCEKPLVLSSKEARELKARANAAGVFLMEAIWSRFLPAEIKAREWAAGGKIGELRAVTSSFCFKNTQEDSERVYLPELGGGSVYDIGIYNLQLAQSLARGRKLLELKATAVPSGTGVDIAAFAHMLYEGGFVSEFKCGFNFTAPNEAYIYGSKGYIRIAPYFHQAQLVELYTSRKPSEDYAAPSPDETFLNENPSGFEYEIRHFVDCVAKGLLESPALPLDDTIELAELTEKILGKN
jgi:predicted dehydrogenase